MSDRALRPRRAPSAAHPGGVVTRRARALRRIVRAEQQRHAAVQCRHTLTTPRGLLRAWAADVRRNPQWRLSTLARLVRAGLCASCARGWLP